jgi:hypothetical protein
MDGTVKKPSPRRLPRAGEVRAAVILLEVARIATERNNGMMVATARRPIKIIDAGQVRS